MTNPPNFPFSTPARIDRKTRRKRFTRTGTITVIFALLSSLLASVLGVAAPPASAIVKGSEARLGEHPYQVALEDRDGQFCGGSLIDTAVVLTAAHCLDGLNPKNLSIRAGVVDLNRPGQVIGVNDAVVHEKWRGENGDSSYDIALLFLDKAVTLNANVGLIDAESGALSSAAKPGTSVVVSGWGALTERSQKEVTKLRHTTVELIGDTACAQRLRDESIDNFSMICTVGTGNGSCYGDSGGPLARRNNDGSWTQVGIVSWGTVCGSRLVAGVYSDLVNLRTWITANRPATTPPAAVPAPTPTPTPTPTPNKVQVAVTSSNVGITIPAHGEAPFTSMNVATKAGSLVDVDVILRGLSHQRVADLDVIVVSPAGTEVTLLSDAGGNRNLPPTGIRFDDEAQTGVGASGLVPGRYLPTSNVPGLPSADLSEFDGEDPNGEWELYVFDAVEGKRGTIAGWTLVTKTR